MRLLSTCLLIIFIATANAAGCGDASGVWNETNMSCAKGGDHYFVTQTGCTLFMADREDKAWVAATGSIKTEAVDIKFYNNKDTMNNEVKGNIVSDHGQTRISWANKCSWQLISRYIDGRWQDSCTKDFIDIRQTEGKLNATNGNSNAANKWMGTGMISGVKNISLNVKYMNGTMKMMKGMYSGQGKIMMGSCTWTLACGYIGGTWTDQCDKGKSKVMVQQKNACMVMMTNMNKTGTWSTAAGQFNKGGFVGAASFVNRTNSKKRWGLQFELFDNGKMKYLMFNDSCHWTM